MLSFDWSHALVKEGEVDAIAAHLAPELSTMREVVAQGGYDDVRASLDLVDDVALVKRISKLKKKVDVVVVVGIGGSNLGTLAVQEAVLGKLSNLWRKPKIFYADTVDPKTTKDILQLCKNKRVLINIVTKSGSTTETIANAEIFSDVGDVVVTTDANSPLWHLAQDKGYDALEIPKKVGGRYSVFSAVSLFPLTLLGVDVPALLKGAREMRDRCLEEESPAVTAAAIQYWHAQRGKNIHDSFFFSTDLESLGKWERQLFAESLGKQGKGFTPTVSIGTTDLHSMAQLYLGGPADKFTTFVTVKKDERVIIPKRKWHPEIEGKSFEAIRNAIFAGVAAAYRKRQRPFVHLELADRSEKSIGAYLQLRMIETILLGRLFGVNPFDQPNVEEYKEETRRLLRRA